MRGFERISIASLSVCLVVAAAAAIQSQGRGESSEWRYYGGNKAFNRYSPLDQITRDNVKNLKIAWRRPAVSEQLTQAFPDVRVNNYLRATPIFIDGRLFTQNAHGLVVAFDGESGKTVWEQELFARTREEANGASTRGVDYWRGGSGNADKRIFAIRGEYLYALNAETGKPVAGFGDQGRASLHFDEGEQPLAGRFNDSTGPLVVGNVVVVTGNTAGAGDTGTMKKEAAPEDVRGFDAQSGKLLWTFHVVPRPGEFGNDTWGNDSWKIAGDLGAWNPMTARRRARLRLHPADRADRARPMAVAPGRQPLLRLAGRARREDRQARLALPDRCTTTSGTTTTSGRRCWPTSRSTDAASRP